MAKQSRIDVYVPDPELRRRIKIAAARQDMPVSRWCLEAIRQQLAKEEMLEGEQVKIPIKQAKDNTLSTQHGRRRRRQLGGLRGRALGWTVLSPPVRHLICVGRILEYPQTFQVPNIGQPRCCDSGGIRRSWPIASRRSPLGYR